MRQQQPQPRPALDQWVSRELKRTYNATLDADLPEELMALLGRFATQH